MYSKVVHDEEGVLAFGDINKRKGADARAHRVEEARLFCATGGAIVGLCGEAHL
jgi:hypothetical protein